jgi:hypothetical protein
MGIKKLIERIESTLGLKNLKQENKKKSLKSLMEKLNRKQKIIEKSLESSPKNKELKEELQIVSLLIKKVKQQLAKLSS